MLEKMSYLIMSRDSWLILFYRGHIRAQNFACMKVKITTRMAHRKINCVIMYERKASTTLLLQCWFFQT